MLTVITGYYGQPEEAVETHVTASARNSLKPKEIIIVNDGHPNNLHPLCEKIKRLVPIVLVELLEDVKWNIGGALNTGIWLAQTEYISIEDMDVIPFTDYYKTAVMLLMTGQYDQYFSFIANDTKHHEMANVARRSAYTDNGGFCEDLAGEWGYHDILLWNVMRSRGVKAYQNDYPLIRVNDDGVTPGHFRHGSLNAEKTIQILQGEYRPRPILRVPYKVTRYE